MLMHVQEKPKGNILESQTIIKNSSATKSKKVKDDTAQPTLHSFIKSKGTLDKKSKKYERITYNIAKTIVLSATECGRRYWFCRPDFGNY